MKLPDRTTLLAAAKVIGRDAVGVVGFGMIGHGIAAIYPPAAWIVTGAALAAWAYLQARASK